MTAVNLDVIVAWIDILFKPTPENAQRVLAALTQVGYDVTDLTADEALAKKFSFGSTSLPPTFIHPRPVFRSKWSGKIA